MPPKKDKKEIPSDKNQMTLERWFSLKGKETQKQEKEEEEEPPQKTQPIIQQQPEVTQVVEKKKKKVGRKPKINKDIPISKTEQDDKKSVKSQKIQPSNREQPQQEVPKKKRRRKWGKGRGSLSKCKSLKKRSVSKPKVPKQQKEQVKSKPKSKSSKKQQQSLSEQLFGGKKTIRQEVKPQIQIEDKQPKVVQQVPKIKRKKGGKSRSKPKVEEKPVEKMEVQGEQNEGQGNQRQKVAKEEKNKQMDIENEVDSEKDEKKEIVKKKKRGKYIRTKKGSKKPQQNAEKEEIQVQPEPAPILYKMHDPKYAFLLADQQPLSDTQYIFDKTQPATLKIAQRNLEGNEVTQSIKAPNDKPKASQGKPVKKRSKKQGKGVDKEKSLQKNPKN